MSVRLATDPGRRHRPLNAQRIGKEAALQLLMDKGFEVHAHDGRLVGDSGGKEDTHLTAFPLRGATLQWTTVTHPPRSGVKIVLFNERSHHFYLMAA
ncbi:hypothetical protein KBD61_02570 [Patescibacteria group bacterium]|nr:hypothetical protein [Patescibacteria group bacterium]MBP9709890.1 hypothetical protein [Patescibacteria group bacterium]